MNLSIPSRDIDYVSFLGQNPDDILENLRALFGPKCFTDKGASIELNVVGALIYDLCKEIIELRDNKSLSNTNFNNYGYLKDFIENTIPICVSEKIDNGGFQMLNPFVSDVARDKVSKMLVLSFAKELNAI